MARQLRAAGAPFIRTDRVQVPYTPKVTHTHGFFGRKIDLE